MTAGSVTRLTVEVPHPWRVPAATHQRVDVGAFDVDYPQFLHRLLDRYIWLQSHEGLPGEREAVVAMLVREGEVVCRLEGLPFPAVAGLVG